MRIEAYAVRLNGSTHETLINASTPGKAKSEFMHRLDGFDVKFTDIRVRAIGGPVTPDALRRTAEYRGVPFVRVGMRVKVGDDFGRIVGSNCDANFDVEFEPGSRFAGEILNVHPRWQITYYDDAGGVLASFDTGRRVVLKVDR